jgi:hypothetical protein
VASPAPTGSILPPPAVQVPMQMQIGDFYAFTVPDGMHVTEYSTNKTYNTSLDFYRISTTSDPFYLGNYPCKGQFDQQVTFSGDSSGTMYNYCQSTPPEDVFKWLMSATIANNHLEVATNAPLVTEEQHEYIDINVFDANYEYMTGRSRFETLCLNQHGNITLSPPMAVINQEFWGTGPVLANFVMCTTDLTSTPVGTLPTLDPTGWRNSWWVGAFFISSSGQQLPHFECLTQQDETYGSPAQLYHYDPQFCGAFANPSLLEVTYVTKTPYPNPQDFAFAAWQEFQKYLVQIQPLGPAIPAATPPGVPPIGALGGPAAPTYQGTPSSGSTSTSSSSTSTTYTAPASGTAVSSYPASGSVNAITYGSQP